MIEPPCTDRYARWWERSAGQLMVSLLLDCMGHGLFGGYSWCNIEFQYESEYEDGVTYYSCYSNPLVYAHNLFIDGIQVTELVIPNEISEIKAFAFNGGNITQLTLHSNIDCIGIGAFMTCYGFSKLVIPEGVTNIEVKIMHLLIVNLRA